MKSPTSTHSNKTIGIIIALPILAFSCLQSNSSQTVNQINTVEPELVTGHQKVERNYTAELKDSEIVYYIKAKNGERSEFLIRSSGLIHNMDTVFSYEGSMLLAKLLDLDKNGYPEIYLVIRPTDDSGNLILIGFASIDNKHLKEIEIRDTELIRMVNSDQIEFSGNTFIRSFRDVENKPVSFGYRLSTNGDQVVLESQQITAEAQ